jgi:putative Holliday junction resolvase
MRYLGIDYGGKRTGVAFAASGVAVVKEVIESTSERVVIERLEQIVDSESIDAIVVGLPTNMQGENTQMTDRVQQFVARLAEAVELPVHTTDERLTSVMAESLTREMRGAQTDQVAAQILLQNFLDQQS